MLDGASLTKPGGSADEMQSLRWHATSERCWNEAIRSRRDIEGLEREVLGLRGDIEELERETREVRELLARK